MFIRAFLLTCVCSLVFGQASDTPAALQHQSEALRSLVERSPRLPLAKTEFQIQPAGTGWELGFASAVAMSKDGLLYVLQRGEKADPVLVVNPEGKIIRSWGKGLYNIPHSIRIDPAGHIWTVDAASSKVLKFSPTGEKLLEISVGGQPKTSSAFNGTTDIAFGPHGRLFISDGYGNARILEYTAAGKLVKQWGSAGSRPGEFHLPHGITVDESGTIYVADRENGRVQRFTLDGKYLGEWTNLGKVFAVTASHGRLWIGTQQRNEPNGAPGWLMEIDKHSGKVVGLVDSAGGQHTVNLATDGGLLAGARPNTILWFRKKAK
jgi:sugar lactone lactonase YvrE